MSDKPQGELPLAPAKADQQPAPPTPAAHSEPPTEVVRPEDAAAARPPAKPTDEELLEGSFEGDYLLATIDVADKLDAYEKAVDKVLSFIIRRAYPHDWVSHGKKNDALDDRTANLIGAAAERIARDLGISEMNRTAPEKFWHDQDKHPRHFYYQCEADYVFRGRKIHAIGRASTLNPFHTKKKAPDQVREEYIMQECWRDATKQGIKGLFGLRKIPVTKLKELGLDVSKIKYVNFGENDDSQSATNPGATARPEGAEGADAERVTVVLASMQSRNRGDVPITDFTDAEGVTYSWYGRGGADKGVQGAIAAMKAKKAVTVVYRAKGDYRNIVAVEVPS